MSTLDWILLGGIALMVILIIVLMVRRKSKGQGGCANCPYSGSCDRKNCEK